VEHELHVIFAVYGSKSWFPVRVQEWDHCVRQRGPQRSLLLHCMDPSVHIGAPRRQLF